jgi:hypothetical protein
MFGGFSWVIIAILVVAFLLVLKARHIKHRFFAAILVLLVIFLYFTASSLFANKNLDFGTFDGWVGAGKIYFSWLGHALGNLKVVIGNAFKLDWVNNTPPINATG